MIKGKTPSARFCKTSMSPKAVPRWRGFTSIGIVGIIAVQNSAMEMPNSVTGTKRIHYSSLMDELVSMKNMKA